MPGLSCRVRNLGRRLAMGYLCVGFFVIGGVPASAQTDLISSQAVKWQVHDFQDQSDTRAQYFTTGTGHELVLILQGSGCVPAFAKIDGHDNVATSLQDGIAKRLGGRAHIMIVERPGLRPNDPIFGIPGQSEGCPAEFKRRYSLSDWGKVIRSALEDFKPPDRIAIIGISEGTKTATWEANHGFEGPILSIGGAGCDGDLVGMLAQSIERTRERRPGTSLSDTIKTIHAIEANPIATDKYAWGHTYLRWSTFGDQCSRESLEIHTGLVDLAYGTEDAGADASTIERLARTRALRALPTRVDRVEGGDHGLFVGEHNEAIEVVDRFYSEAFGAAPHAK
jgi:hypothetical protein